MLHTQIRSFHAVAEEGGFTAAARALNVSQPTITVQVRTLEDYYNVELFHRRGRKVVLTDTGREHAAHQYIVDLVHAHTGMFNCSADCRGTQFVSGHITELALE